MEDSGYVFKNNNGIQKDCLEILKQKHINALRFRVWINPPNKYNSKRDVAYMAQRADSMGFDVMIDFHMSDTWADPLHQLKPAAWANDSFNQLKTDVYNHVYGVLDTLKSLGVIPKWVQIGNEVNDGMLWEDGRASKNMSNFAQLINSGYDAVKAIDNSIQVIVHISNGWKNDLYKWIFKGLHDYNAKWDIIGMSVYPAWSDSSTWQKTNNGVLANMKDMIATYNKKVMVCETGFAADQPGAAKQFLIDLIEKTKSVDGLGVFYWEPESYNWQGYGLGAWDWKTQQPTAAMDAFVETSTSVKNYNIPTGYSLDIYPNPFNPSTTIKFSIPNVETRHASSQQYVTVKIYDMLGREIETLVDEQKSPGNYEVKFNGSQLSSGIYFCQLRSGSFILTQKMVFLK